MQHPAGVVEVAERGEGAYEIELALARRKASQRDDDWLLGARRVQMWGNASKRRLDPSSDRIFEQLAGSAGAQALTLSAFHCLAVTSSA